MGFCLSKKLVYLILSVKQHACMSSQDTHINFGLYVVFMNPPFAVLSVSDKFMAKRLLLNSKYSLDMRQIADARK